nr:MAG TPA: hypothetical protein [Caudoviricetes sp.]
MGSGFAVLVDAELHLYGWLHAILKTEQGRVDFELFELSWTYPGLKIVNTKEFGTLVKGYSVCGPKGVLAVI